jgi:hypothetical protein
MTLQPEFEQRIGDDVGAVDLDDVGTISKSMQGVTDARLLDPDLGLRLGGIGPTRRTEWLPCASDSSSPASISRSIISAGLSGPEKRNGFVSTAPAERHHTECGSTTPISVVGLHQLV